MNGVRSLVADSKSFGRLFVGVLVGIVLAEAAYLLWTIGHSWGISLPDVPMLTSGIRQIYRYEGVALVLHLPMAVVLIGTIVLHGLHARGRTTLYAQHELTVRKAVLWVYKGAAPVGLAQTLLSFTLMFAALVPALESDASTMATAILRSMAINMPTAFGSTLVGISLFLIAMTYRVVTGDEDINGKE